jgi:hypothetical protein
MNYHPSRIRNRHLRSNQIQGLGCRRRRDLPDHWNRPGLGLGSDPHSEMVRLFPEGSCLTEHRDARSPSVYRNSC